MIIGTIVAVGTLVIAAIPVAIQLYDRYKATKADVNFDFEDSQLDDQDDDGLYDPLKKTTTEILIELNNSDDMSIKAIQHTNELSFTATEILEAPDAENEPSIDGVVHYTGISKDMEGIDF
ncbi:MAG: hypothetical protein HRU35_00680 [Rickettsiaceae bacterium]|nr:hypothetical protein [Rickettsiaceae bacterium]